MMSRLNTYIVYIHKYEIKIDNLLCTSINKFVLLIITYIVYIYTFINVIAFLIIITINVYVFVSVKLK